MSAKIDPSNVEQSGIEHDDTNQWISVVDIFQSDESPEFALFKLKQGYTQFTIFYCVCQTLMNLWRIVMTINDTGIPLPLRIMGCVRIINPILGWAQIYRMKKYVPSDVLNAEGRRIMLLGDGMSIIHALITGAFILTWIATHANCGSRVCVQDLPDKTVPLDMVLYVLGSSISMPIFYTCHHVFASLLSIVITYSALLAVGCMAYITADDILGLLFMSSFTFFIVISFEGNMFSNFTNYSKFEITLRMKVTSENQEYLMQIQTEEMRHMIGV
jgi:hypothetical protein